jgi:hypothetical protein
MERSGFSPGDGLLAQGYDFRPPRPVSYRGSLLSPAGDLMSSPAEFARFLQALVKRQPASLDRMERGRTSLAAQAGVPMYGLGNYPWPGAVRRQGHSGLIHGFRSSYFYLPDAGIGYVVMCNSSVPGGGSAELYRIVHEYAAGSAVKRLLPPPYSGELALERFAGVYLPADYRSQIAAFAEAYPRARRVTMSDGTLYVGGLFGEGRRKLVPVTVTTFRGEQDVEPTVAFVDGAMTGRAGHFERVRAWQPYAYAGTVAAAFLLMASSVVYALVWVWRRRTAVRVVPLAAVLCLAAAGLLVSAGVDDMSVLGTANVRTVGYCLFSWLFVGLGFTGLVLARQARAIHPLLVSVACCVVAAALADWGLLGIRLWQY